MKFLNDLKVTIINAKWRPFWLCGLMILVFCSAVGFWYSPVLFKGSSVELMTEEVVLARNYALTGRYAMENKLNVVVPPSAVGAEAQPSSSGNKFSAISYSLIFKLFGWQGWNNLVFIGVVICAISLIFFTLAVYVVFGWPVALIFPFVFILLPFNAQTAQYVGFLEFAQLYFSLFVFLYFFGRCRKHHFVYLAISGIFLAAACLAREVYFVFLPILFFWQFFRKQSKELFAVFIPVALLLALFWLPSIFGIGSQNDYAKIFVQKDPGEQAHNDFHYYGHFYPDPYTYHFDRQRVIDRFNADIANPSASWLYRVDRLKTGQNMGVAEVGLLGRLVVGTNNFMAHVSKFFAIEYIGGPLISILLLYGFWALKERDRSLYGLFLFWLAGSVLIISYVVLAIRNHLMDFAWPIAVLIALALSDLPLLLSNHFKFKKYAKIVSALIVIIVLYSLILANHVYFGRGYDGNRNLCLEFLAQKVQELNIGDNEVIAVGEIDMHPILNYLSGKAVVYFDPATVIRLAGEGKLQDALDKYNIKYIAGFDASTSAFIIANSSTTNISSWPDPAKLSPPVSPLKSWLLNLIK